ncbi:hypothetical protein AMAG_09500, partial [Allomyces macrogynus ATCC 38327]
SMHVDPHAPWPNCKLSQLASIYPSKTFKPMAPQFLHLPADILRLVAMHILNDDGTFCKTQCLPMSSTTMTKTIVALRCSCRTWMHVVDSLLDWHLHLELDLILQARSTVELQISDVARNQDQILLAFTYRAHLAGSPVSTPPIFVLDSIAMGRSASNATLDANPSSPLPVTVHHGVPCDSPFVRVQLDDQSVHVPRDRIRSLKLTFRRCSMDSLADSGLDHAPGLANLVACLAEWLPNIAVFHQLAVGLPARAWARAPWASTLTSLRVCVSPDWDNVATSLVLPSMLDLRIDSATGTTGNGPAIRTLPVAPRLQVLFLVVPFIHQSLLIHGLPQFAGTLQQLTVKRCSVVDDPAVVAPTQMLLWHQLRSFRGVVDVFNALIARSASFAEVAEFPALQSLSLFKNARTVGLLPPLLPRFPCLVSVQFVQMLVTQSFLSSMSAVAPCLSSLKLHKCTLALASSPLPSRLTFPSLTKLGVYGTQTAMDLAELLDAPCLAHVEWCVNDPLTAPAIPWPSVTFVSIDNFGYMGGPVKISGAQLDALVHLTSLHLPGRDVEWMDAAPTLRTVTHLQTTAAALATFPPHALPNLVHLEFMFLEDPPFRVLPAAATHSLRRIKGNLHPNLIEQLARMPKIESIGRHRVDLEDDATLPEWTLDYSQGHAVWSSVPRMELTGRIADQFVVRVVSVQDVAKAVSEIERMVEWVIKGGQFEEPLPVEVHLVDAVDVVTGRRLLAALAGVDECDLHGRFLAVAAVPSSAGSPRLRLRPA